MSALNELEALQDGLTSPFWELFKAHVRYEWGPDGVSFQKMYQEGIKDKNWEKVIAANAIQEAMHGILNWPQTRLQAVKALGLRELVEIRSRGGV